MREYVAKTGGRYTYIEDFTGLQELSLSLASIFDGCKNFIISGCKTSGSNNNMDISAGYVYINGKIRYFEGKTVDLSTPFYIVEKNESYDVSYAQNPTQLGYIEYGCEGSNKMPLDERQYIKITDSYIPRLKDEFFGKYAVTLDSSFEQQTISKNIVMEKDLHVKGNIINRAEISIKNPDKQVEIEERITSEGNAQFTFLKDGKESSRLLFGFDGMIRFMSDGIEKLVITPTNVAINELMTNEIRSNELLISGTDIYNYFDNSDNGSVNINRSGYDGGSTKSRHFNVYNGKKKLLFRSDGATDMNYSYCTINEESSCEFGFTLRDTLHKYNESAYIKSIAWKDKDGVLMGTVGFSETSQNDLRIKHHLQGNITLQGTKVNIVGELQNNGETLSSKYASKSYVDEGLDKKVNAVSGKVLSDENFTSSYKAKLDRINPDDYANGDDINQAVSGALKAANNLSDVHDKSIGRNNLQVYSKNECDTAYLRKDKKLTDLPDDLSDTEKAAIRAKIGAGASTIEGEVESIKASMKSMIKEYCDANCVSNIEGLTLLKNVTSNVGNLTFCQRGQIVSIMGKTPRPSGDNSTWFSIPNDIGAPKSSIGGTFLSDTTTNKGSALDNVYGVVWKCEANTRTITTISANKDDTIEYYVCITYITN